MVVILFVCTGNAARSQMEEGLLRNQKPVKVMEELNLDISNHTSNHLDEVDWKGADVAITLCGSANESCVSMPWPEKCKRIHWPINDPVTLDEYRKARDEIKERIEAFLTNI